MCTTSHRCPRMCHVPEVIDGERYRYTYTIREIFGAHALGVICRENSWYMYHVNVGSYKHRILL